MKTRILAPLALALAALAAPGCTRIEKTAVGWRYSNGVFWKRAESIELSGSTNGAYQVKVRGYQSDADAVVGLAREAIALGKSAAPVP